MRVFLVVVMLAMLASCAISAQANLIVNGDLETGLVNGAWGVAAEPITIDSTVAHSGQYSLKMGATTSFPYAWVPVVDINTQYELSFWVKDSYLPVDGAIRGAVMPVSGLYADPSNPVPQYVGTGQPDWHKETFLLKSDGTGYAAIYFTIYAWGTNNTHELWLDDVSLEKVGGLVPEPSSIIALLSGLVGIGGFAIRKRK